MKGWISEIDIWAAGGNWDSIFNKDSDFSTSIDDFVTS